MQKQKSIKQNFIMNVILTTSSFLFPFITFPYVSRVLLPAGMGKVSFATSLISYFSMFAQLGIPTYGIRVCAKARDQREELTRTVHELLFLNLIMDVISYACLFAALLFIPRLLEDRSLYLIMSATVFLTSIGVEWLYKALEQYTYITFRSLLFKVISLAAMFLLVHGQEDYVIYGAISIFASSASNVCNFINIHKYVDLKWMGGYRIRRHLGAVLTFFAMACATTIYTNLDVVMLGFMATDADVGYYNAAVKIKTILVSIVTSLGAVLLPRASYYIEHEMWDEFKKISGKAIHFVVLIGLPMALYFIIFARAGIHFLSGSAYEASVLPMRVIMPTVFLIGITDVLGIQILVPLGKEKIVLRSEIVGVVVDLALNAILIPRLASTGAAIGTLVAEAAVLLVQYLFLQDEVEEILRGIPCSRIFVALLLGTLGSVWVLALSLNSFLRLVLSALFYFGIYGVYLFLRKEDFLVEICAQALRMLGKRKK